MSRPYEYSAGWLAGVTMMSKDALVLRSTLKATLGVNDVEYVVETKTLKSCSQWNPPGSSGYVMKCRSLSVRYQCGVLLVLPSVLELP